MFFHLQTAMIEVFKTNVHEPSHAEAMLRRLHSLFPTYRINFDLDDCDRILRVQSPGDTVQVGPIMSTLAQAGFSCSVLED